MKKIEEEASNVNFNIKRVDLGPSTHKGGIHNTKMSQNKKRLKID